MESSTLAPVLSYILTKMVERNDKIPLDDSKRTVFHAQKAPLISLHRYLERVLSFAPCSNSCFIIALIYIDRIIQNSDFILNSLSVHRMLITSVMLATKFFDDETFNNLYYAKVGGLQVLEVNQLENKFLSLIKFSLTIRSDLFDRYHCELVKHAKVSCSSKVAVAPLRSKLSYDSFQPCQRPIEKSFHPLSRSSGSISSHTISKSNKAAVQVSPQATQSPIQIRNICESLITDTVNSSMTQPQLVGRVTEMPCVEEKLHQKLLPNSIKAMCSKVGLEHNLPQNFVTKTALQVEQMERESSSYTDSSYQHGFDYAAREMIFTSDISTSGNATGTGEGGNPGTSTGAIKGRANFSMCTPSYPNHHMYGNRLLGVI